MTDRFSSRHATPTSPAYDGFSIAADDALPLQEVTRAVYIGVAGDLTAMLISGETVTFENLPAGFILPVRISRVFATGTTAGALVGLV
ncbi:spike base protein, RCAP_Rcc01079 family [Martelella radicis]|uniref:Uncharacterized protein n=1 Tax=Martelella radicis TaxID=1397476 RepID=A0A7W6KLL2_9HYPH|nr:hypothetical protein [Martelella radicis]MBB4122123.1 hypothetical protein [Martelella radicis]